jgi:hypothetical protein
VLAERQLIGRHSLLTMDRLNTFCPTHCTAADKTARHARGMPWHNWSFDPGAAHHLGDSQNERMPDI